MGYFPRRLIAALGVVAFLATLSPAAKADDYKVFPGSGCARENPLTYGDNAQPHFSLLSGAYFNNSTNLSTGYEHVLCPITRDQFKNTSGLKNMLISVYNSGHGRYFECDLQSFNKFGGASASSPLPGFPGMALSFTTFKIPTTTVGFAQMPLKATASVLSGYYSIHCEVPPGGYIYSYQIQEVPNTDAN